MGKIFIDRGTSFLSSNISNYLIQHTSYDIVTADNLLAPKTIDNLRPSLAAKSRHSFYAIDDIGTIYGKLFFVEKPDVIISYSTFGDHLEALENKNNATVIVLVKDLRFWQTPDYFDKFKKYYIIEYCEVFGPRQSLGNFVPARIVSLINGDKIECENQSEEKKQWMYVKDFFEILCENFLIDNSLESGIYRITSGQFASKKDICLFLSEIANKGHKHEWDLFRDFEVDEKTIIGYKNEITNALEHTFVWYNMNRWFWS